VLPPTSIQPVASEAGESIGCNGWLLARAPQRGLCPEQPRRWSQHGLVRIRRDKRAWTTTSRCFQAAPSGAALFLPRAANPGAGRHTLCSDGGRGPPRPSEVLFQPLGQLSPLFTTVVCHRLWVDYYL